MSDEVTVIFLDNVILLKRTAAAAAHLRIHPDAFRLRVHVHGQVEIATEELLLVFGLCQKAPVLLETKKGLCERLVRFFHLSLM